MEEKPSNRLLWLWLLKFSIITTVIKVVVKHFASTLLLLIFPTTLWGRGCSYFFDGNWSWVLTDSFQVSPLRWGREVWAEGWGGFSCTQHCFSRWFRAVLYAGGAGRAGLAEALWSCPVSFLAFRCPVSELLPKHWLIIHENSLRGCLHPGGTKFNKNISSTC